MKKWGLMRIFSSVASGLLIASMFAACADIDESSSDTPAGGGSDVDTSTRHRGGTGGQPGGSGGSGGAGGGDVMIINQGFIGGPCANDDDCRYPAAICKTEGEGFADGMCSLDCKEFCPDQTGAVPTFCIDPQRLSAAASDGLCVIRCDYGQSDTGCRTGYQCQPATRFGDPNVQAYVCVPGTDNPFVLGACHEELLNDGLAFSPAVEELNSPVGHPELSCIIKDPVWLTPVLHGVSFRPASIEAKPKAMFTSCAHAMAMNKMAVLLAELNVSDLVHYGIYSCRTVANGTKLSQHAFANAIDIAGLRLDGGPYYVVKNDWELFIDKPVLVGGKLFKSFTQTMFSESIYNVILTPDYDEAHADHFHCDLTPGSHFLR